MFKFKRLPFVAILTAVFIIFLFVVLAVNPPAISQNRISVISILKIPLKLITGTTQIAKNTLKFPFIFHENRQLIKTVGALYSRLVRLEELSQENARLKRLLNLKSQSRFYLVPAQVIGRDISNWASSIIIDRGTLSRIKRGSPVVTEYGLAGKIVEASPDTSRVMLINDFNMHVPAVIQRSRQMGLVVGSLQGGCKMIYLSKEADIKPDDIVITSGISDAFPKGIIIGKITSVSDNFGGLGKTATITPSVNFSSIEEVLVIAP